MGHFKFFYRDFLLVAFVALAGGVGVLAASTAAAARRLDADAWAETLRARALEESRAPYPLSATGEMADAARRWAGSGDVAERLERLRAALLDPEEFSFAYDSTETLYPPEAFHLRRGNCLSFTALFIALARSAGLPLQAARPLAPVESERVSDLVVISYHVVALYRAGDRSRVFDFGHDRSTFGAFRPIDDLEFGALFLSNLAVADLRAARFEPAADRLQAALRLAPDLGTAWSNLAVARRRTGDYVGALAAYAKALEAAPTDPIALTNLASLYLLLGRGAEARLALEAAGARASSSYDGLLVRGQLAERLDQNETALRLFRQARRTDPRRLDAHLLLAQTHLRMGELGAGRRALQRAFAIDPTDPETLALMNGLGSGGR